MAKEMKKKKGLSLTAKKGIMGYVFLLPIIIGAVFIFLPALVESLIYSFHNVTITFEGMQMEYIGFQNYIDAFLTDTSFVTLLINAVRGMFFDSAVIILFSFFMANVLNQKFVGRGVCRAVFFLPVVVAVGIVADLESSNEMYNAMSGLTDEVTTGTFDQIGFQTLFSVNRLLTTMGLPTAMTSIVQTVLMNMYNILNSVGVQILIFLSALQAINPSVFEAAKMEGATKWEEFWKITFPILTPSLLVCVVYTVISTFTNPVYGVLDYVQGKAFSNGQLGFASSLSWIYSIIVLVVLGIVTAILARRVTYLD